MFVPALEGLNSIKFGKSVYDLASVDIELECLFELIFHACNAAFENAPAVFGQLGAEGDVVLEYSLTFKFVELVVVGDNHITGEFIDSLAGGRPLGKALDGEYLRFRFHVRYY